MTKLQPGWYELHVQIPVDMRDAIRKAAEHQERTVTAWVRRAIREKLERDEMSAPTGDRGVVNCDDNCGALECPTSPAEMAAALAHWMYHDLGEGCSHGR